MDENPYNSPSTLRNLESRAKQPTEEKNWGPVSVCLATAGLLFALATLVALVLMLGERNTGAREAYMFDMYRDASVVAAVISGLFLLAARAARSIRL
jgi:hypothetical protein